MFLVDNRGAGRSLKWISNVKGFALRILPAEASSEGVFKGTFRSAIRGDVRKTHEMTRYLVLLDLVHRSFRVFNSRHFTGPVCNSTIPIQIVIYV